MQYDVNAAVLRYKEARRQRLELDDLSKKIKEELEEPLKAELLEYLGSQGLQNAKTAHGTIAQRKNTRVEVLDIETVCSVMLENMLKLRDEGKPLADALLLQKTAHKANVTEVVNEILGNPNPDEEQFNEVASRFGMRAVSKIDLSLTAK